VNRDRIFFEPKLPPQGKLFLDVFVEGNKVKVRAGAAHGVTEGAEFTLYQSPDKESPKLGEFPIKELKASSCTLEGIDPTKINLPAFALQSKVSEEDALRVCFANKPGMYEIKEVLMKDLDAENSILEQCSFVDKDDDAQIEVDVEDDHIIFNAVDSTIVRVLGLTHMPYRINAKEREIACNVIRAASHFDRYLSYSPKEPTIGKDIDVEFVKVARLGRHKWGPASQTGGNLLHGNYIQIVADKTLYGIKITNNSNIQLYPHLFLFDCSDLSISKYSSTSHMQCISFYL
jgi:hypothetical protein